MINKNNTDKLSLSYKDKLREELYEIYRDVDFDKSLHGELSLWQFIDKALTQARQQGYEEAVEEVRKQMAGELLKTQALADMSRGDGVKNVDMTAVEYSAIITRFTRFLTTLTKNEK